LRDHFAEVTSSAETTSPVTRVKPRRSLWIPLVAAITLLAGFMIAYFWTRPAAPQLVVSRTLTYSGSDSSPAISPDRQFIAFRSDRDGLPRIWLKQMSGGNEIALTEGPDDYPRFSPDGSVLLFIRKQGASGSLFRVPVLGGEPRKVIDDAISADWSSDGKRIAFVRWTAGDGGLDSQVMIVKQDGSNPEKIVEIKDRQLLSVRWSPDNRSILSTVVIQGNYGNKDAIALIDVKNKTSRWIPSTSNNPTAAVWARKKNQIAYFLPETGVALFQLRGASRLFLQDIETGERKPVFWTQSTGDIMDLAGPGQMILHSASLRENLREASIDSNHQVTSWSWLTRGNSANRQPSYSPDGKRLLFSSNMGGNLDLWDLSTETRGLRRITEDSAEDWDPSYSPDGKFILWSSNRNGHFEIWIANADGSGARQVTQDGVDAENPCMTPDGKWIIYNSYNPDLRIRGVWRIQPNGTGATRIASGLTQWPEISPDGKYVSYGFYKQSLNDRLTYERVVETETRKVVPFEIEVSNRDRVGGRMRWMPDGKSIVFIDEDQNGNWGLFKQDFTPGKDSKSTRTPIAGFEADRKIDTFAISADGKRLTLAEVEVLSTLMMAEGIPD
jgi:Tol biopolymer transport system component